MIKQNCHVIEFKIHTVKDIQQTMLIQKYFLYKDSKFEDIFHFDLWFWKKIIQYFTLKRIERTVEGTWSGL